MRSSAPVAASTCGTTIVPGPARKASSARRDSSSCATTLYGQDAAGLPLIVLPAELRPRQDVRYRSDCIHTTIRHHHDGGRQPRHLGTEWLT